MSAVKLPHALEEKLGDLAQQVRRLWLYRGISWFALLFFGSALGLILLDAQLELAGSVRLLGVVSWAILQFFAFRRLVLRPIRNPIPVPLLASAIENQFPNLAERLTTLVELSENAEPGNGSKALIEVLARDTAQRAKKLNFFKAAPTGSVLRLGLLSVLIAVAIVSPLFFVPGAAERVRRFLLPWGGAKSDIGFKVQVSSKNLVLKRNDSVTLTGYLERLNSDAVLPEIAVLIYKEAGGEERKLPMTGDEKAAFTVTRPIVKDGFDYCLEASGLRSDWYKVTVVDAVELTEGTQFSIHPPSYAKEFVEVVEQQGLQEFQALQYSKVKFDLKFNRPARSATFEWKPANANAQIVGEQFFVNLSNDRTGGNAEWMLNGEGTLKLVITGEQNVRSEVVIATKATLDAPPKFEKVVGVSEMPRDVRPGDRVPIELTITDDIKVDKVELHFELNGDAATRRVLPLALKEIAPGRIDGRYSFDLTDKGRTGEVIRFRIRAVDNRNVPEFNAPPQELFFPEKGWSELRLNPNAKPLTEQDTLAKKEKIKDKLQAAAQDVADALKNVEAVKKEAEGKDQLTPEQIAKLDNAKNKAKDAARELEELAREAGLTPDFRPFANEIRTVAEDTLRQADERLRKAQNEAAPEPRDKAIREAGKELGRANDKLRELLGKADGFAQNLLDKRKLEEIADKEKELAEELKQNPDNERVAREVAKKQQELNAELDQLLKGNETLKKAVEQMAAAQAKELADEAKKLNEQQKNLDEAAKDRAEAAKQKALDGTAQKQKELNAKADELRKKTEEEAKVAGADPLPKEPFDKAGEQLEKGNALDAMTEQEKAARELDRLAKDLERAAADRNDPRKAAQQMAKLEEELRNQAAAAKDPSDELRKKMQKQQEAVKRAAEKLSVPKGNAEAQQAKDEAIEQLEKARKAAGENSADADRAMKDAAEALNRLAEKLPTREDRLKKSKTELEKLQREQDALQREAAEQLKKTEKKNPDEATQKELAEKLADSAKKQQELAEKLEQLDTPGLDKRRDKVAKAAKEAGEDLQKGRPQDVPASQQKAKRQMEQLRQALDGQKSNDQKADELAKKQKEIADAAEKADGKPDANKLQQLQEMQRDIKKELGAIADPNAAEQLNRTKEAVRKAEEALDRKDAEELKKKTKEAAEQLDRLADRLGDAEADAERLERLARLQEAAAEKAQKQAGKPSTPEQTAAAQEELDRELDDLRQTRAGDAQEAKKKANDALERLRRDPNPEKATKLQKDAADAMRKLADEVQKKSERTAKQDKNERGNPDANNQPDDAEGQLPNQKDADAARELAQQQREARDRLGKANEQANRGEKPTDNKKIDELAKKQQQLATETQEFAKQCEGQCPEAGGAAKESQKAADQLKAGNGQKAQAAGDKAQKSLEKAAKDNEQNATGKKANELAEKQKELNREIGEQAKDPGAEAAQQQARQEELAKQADDLAKKLEDAAKDPDNRQGKVDGEKLKKAGEAAREAQKQMDRAKREDDAGRKQNADDARKQAEKALDKAQKDAEEAGGEGEPGQGEPGNKNAQKAGKNLKEAEGKMNQAGKQLGEKQQGQAQKSMEKAAEKLDEAAKQLGDPKGDSKGDPRNANPMNNDGSGQSEPTKTELPKDLQQYLGKPWGELPGDVKSKIIQDLKAKYGEDYARVIKLYFEQIAEKK